MTRIRYQKTPIFCIISNFKQAFIQTNDKSLTRSRKLCSKDYAMSFLNRASLFCLTWSFNLGLFKTINIASKFFCDYLLLDPLAIINQLNL